MGHESIIKKYFDAWINNDIDTVKSIISDHITYIECYGPEYHGINQVITWFHDWQQNGTVLKWDIKQFIHQDNITVVEWYFKCDYNNTIAGFDGVSIVEFEPNEKIVSIKEFQSKAEHNFPYGE